MWTHYQLIFFLTEYPSWQWKSSVGEFSSSIWKRSLASSNRWTRFFKRGEFTFVSRIVRKIFRSGKEHLWSFNCHSLNPITQTVFSPKLDHPFIPNSAVRHHSEMLVTRNRSSAEVMLCTSCQLIMFRNFQILRPSRELSSTWIRRENLAKSNRRKEADRWRFNLLTS